MDRYLTTGQIAKELKTSTQTVRNYCDSGVIKASRSAGGHYRIEPAELDRLKSLESLPPVARATLSATSTRSPAHRNANELIGEPSGDAIESAEEAYRSERDLATDTHQLARLRVRREATELTDWFADRDQARLDKMLEEDRQRQESEERQIQQRQAELAVEERERFTLKWISRALSMYKPADAPADFALLIQDDLLSTLNKLPPTTSDSVVEAFLVASITRSLQPSRAAEGRSQAKQTAVTRALSSLPWRMERDNEWLGKARKAASDAVDAAREDAPASALVTVAELAVQPLIKEFRHEENIHSMLNSVRLQGGSRDDDEDGREAVAAALAGLPTGAGDREIARAKEKALSPIRDRIAVRIQQEQEETDRRKRLAAKERLVQWGLNQIFWHAYRMLREFDYSPDESASQIEQRVKLKIEKALRQLNGDEDLGTVAELVRDQMEEIEGCS